jgi:uncharacterized protein YbcI
MPSENQGQSLSGGELLTAISNRVVAIMRDHYGRGPHRAKTYVIDDIVVCVLRNGFTAVEQTMVEGGQSDQVVVMRHEFQKLMAERYKAMITELTGRRVVAFLSQAHLEPDLTLEVFFVDGPLEGFGSLEVVPDENPPEPA